MIKRDMELINMTNFNKLITHKTNFSIKSLITILEEESSNNIKCKRSFLTLLYL